jgi:hypothetical protein
MVKTFAGVWPKGHPNSNRARPQGSLDLLQLGAYGIPICMRVLVIQIKKPSLPWIPVARPKS